MKKRVWALLLVIACLVTLLSGVASAAETDAKSTVTIRLDLSNYPFEIGQSTKITNEINGIRTLEPGKVNVLQFSTASPINEHDGEIKFNLASLTEAVSWNIADINYKTNNDDIWLGTTGDEMGIWVQAYKGQLVVTVYGYDSGYGTTPGFADITIVPVLLGADYTAKATASSEKKVRLSLCRQKQTIRIHLRHRLRMGIPLTAGQSRMVSGHLRKIPLQQLR